MRPRPGKTAQGILRNDIDALMLQPDWQNATPKDQERMIRQMAFDRGFTIVGEIVETNEAATGFWASLGFGKAIDTDAMILEKVGKLNRQGGLLNTR